MFAFIQALSYCFKHVTTYAYCNVGGYHTYICYCQIYKLCIGIAVDSVIVFHVVVVVVVVVFNDVVFSIVIDVMLVLSIKRLHIVLNLKDKSPCVL